MNTRNVLLITLSVGLVASQAAAQTPVASFEELSAHVSPGVAVIVQLADGRRTTGKLTAIDGDRIGVIRRRWNWRKEQMSFTEESVIRIERHDSLWNGSAVGIAAGAAVAWARCRMSRPDDYSCLAWVPLSPLFGGLIGGLIDNATHQSLYVASRSGVQLRPISGRGVGATVTVGF